MKQANSNQESKRLVAREAAALVRDGMVCGIGTGSTVAFLIEFLGRRVSDEKLRITGVPTSFQSRLLCQSVGIPTADPQDYSFLDLAIDGADEVDPGLNAIKGGGAAHTREKIVAAMAKEFVIIVDESKLVPKLGSTFPVPIEVIPEALRYISETVTRLGGEPQVRMGVKKDGPVITDNGQLVIDARFNPDLNMREIDQVLHSTPGVVETGLFFDLASKVLVASPETMSIRTLTK